MANAWEIVAAVQAKFRGLPVKVAAMNGKTDEWYSSHGRQPKTENPLSSGNVSEVEHYMRYCRKYEGGIRGAGKALNDRVHKALSLEFAENDLAEVTHSALHGAVADEFHDVNKWLINFDFETATIRQLKDFEGECDELMEVINTAKSSGRARRRILESQR